MGVGFTILDFRLWIEDCPSSQRPSFPKND